MSFVLAFELLQEKETKIETNKQTLLIPYGCIVAKCTAFHHPVPKYIEL